MVKLNKIYTRTGDDGTTSLNLGTRIAKSHPRMEVIGDVDETNATIGLARLHTKTKELEGYDAMLARIQHDLFDLGADLATVADDKGEDKALRIINSQVNRLEEEIDAINDFLEPLNSFVLPGGSQASAYLHLARTIARRAERVACALAEKETVNPLALRYLNRLSDHLFVLARALNDSGKTDVLWQPGVNR